MFVYAGLPVIIPVVLFLRRRGSLDRPQRFVLVAFLLCAMVQATIYLLQWAFVATGGTTLVSGSAALSFWMLWFPWLLEAALSIVIVRHVAQRFRTTA